MKNKIKSFLLLFASTFFVLCGCSNEKSNKIVDIDVIKNSTQTEYVVLEETYIEDLLFVVSYANDKVSTYSIADEMFSYSSMDNTVEGEQDVFIYVNNKDYKETLVLKVNFVLPQEVQAINDSIQNLPSINNLLFTDEKTIDEIQQAYMKLDEKYKPYVYEYDNFNMKKDHIVNMKKDCITSDVLNDRYVYVRVLDKIISSIDTRDYSAEALKKISNIYESAMLKINNDNYYSQMYEIVEEARKEIFDVETLKQTELVEYKKSTISLLIAYKASLDERQYSKDNVYQLNNLVLEGSDAISLAVNKNDVDVIYESYLNKLKSISTIKEEQTIALNNLIDKKIIETVDFYSTINMKEYDTNNRSKIDNYLTKCISEIKKSNSEEKINDCIATFKNQVKSVLTLKQQQMLLVIEYKNNAIEEIQHLYNSINMQQYDSKSRNEMKEIVDNSLLLIESMTTYDQINQIINETSNLLTSFKTMEQQYLINLEIRKKDYLEDLEYYSSSYDSSSYSDDKWNIIVNLVNEIKTYINDLTIYDSNASIEKYINDKYLAIESVLTKEQEAQVLLVSIKKESIDLIINYYNNLNQSRYTEAEWEFISNKVNNVINIIELLDNTDAIKKLVVDTINYIEKI